MKDRIEFLREIVKLAGGFEAIGEQAGCAYQTIQKHVDKGGFEADSHYLEALLFLLEEKKKVLAQATRRNLLRPEE